MARIIGRCSFDRWKVGPARAAGDEVAPSETLTFSNQFLEQGRSPHKTLRACALAPLQKVSRAQS